MLRKRVVLTDLNGMKFPCIGQTHQTKQSRPRTDPATSEKHCEVNQDKMIDIRKSRKAVAVVTVVTGSDDDGSTDTREELKMTGVNCLEFTVD